MSDTDERIAERRLAAARDDKTERKLASAREEFQRIGFGYSNDFPFNEFTKHVGRGLVLLTEALEAMEERRLRDER